MAQFETISHGEANWEKKVNNNFSNVTQDTDWQNPVILAPATGNLQFRILNQVLYFRGGIKANAVGDVPVATVPVINKGFVINCIDSWTGSSAACATDQNGKLTVRQRTEDNNEHYLGFDGVAILSSWGGRIPLAQRFGDLLNNLFNTKLEVA